MAAALKGYSGRWEVPWTRAGTRRQDHGLVFCAEPSAPLDPNNQHRPVEAIAGRAGDPAIRDLRHTHKRWLQEAIVTVHVVLDPQGDAKPNDVCAVYSHRLAAIDGLVASSRCGRRANGP